MVGSGYSISIRQLFGSRVLEFTRLYIRVSLAQKQMVTTSGMPKMGGTAGNKATADHSPSHYRPQPGRRIGPEPKQPKKRFPAAIPPPDSMPSTL